MVRKQKRSFAPIDVREFITKNPEGREWIIPGLISRGTTIVFYASPGAGKTLLTYELCKAIATECPWNDLPVMQGKVLLVQTDEPEGDSIARFQRMNFEEIPDGQFKIETTWNFTEVEQLREWIARERPLFVAIDSLTSSNRYSQVSERSERYASILYSLRDIANEYQCTIMLLHHANKNGGMRGSTAIAANVSEVWSFQGEQKQCSLDEESVVRTLAIEKTRCTRPKQYRLQLNPETLSWQLIGELQPHSQANTTPAILLKLLGEVPGGRFTAVQLAQLSGINRETVRRNLEQLAREGFLHKEAFFGETNGGRQKMFRYFVHNNHNNESPDPTREIE